MAKIYQMEFKDDRLVILTSLSVTVRKLSKDIVFSREEWSEINTFMESNKYDIDDEEDSDD